MKQLQVSISRDCIKNAIARDSNRCMIADAIHQQHGWAKYVIVDLQSVRMSNLKTGRRYIYLTPPVAQQALLKFDQGEPLKGFSFTLSRGFTRLMRVRQPGFKRSKKVYKPRAKKRYMPTKHREYGIRKLKA